MLLEARQNRAKPSVVWSRAGRLVSWPSKTRAAKTKPFLIHCFGRNDESRERNIWGSIAGRTTGVMKKRDDRRARPNPPSGHGSFHPGEEEGLSCTTGTAELNLKAALCWSRDSWLWAGTSEGGQAAPARSRGDRSGNRRRSSHGLSSEAASPSLSSSKAP